MIKIFNSLILKVVGGLWGAEPHITVANNNNNNNDNDNTNNIHQTCIEHQDNGRIVLLNCLVPQDQLNLFKGTNY